MNNANAAFAPFSRGQWDKAGLWSEGGEVLANRNVPNGVEPVLRVIGGLPAGTPAAYGAAFGRGWLLELLEGHGFEPHMVHPLQCKAIASARLKNDKAGAATLAQLLRADGAARAGRGWPRSSCPRSPARSSTTPWRSSTRCSRRSTGWTRPRPPG